jgi:hypothetical protein
LKREEKEIRLVRELEVDESAKLHLEVVKLAFLVREYSSSVRDGLPIWKKRLHVGESLNDDERGPSSSIE